jgi:hypothetical protein
MCAAKESRGYLSGTSSTRCILAANCSTASPLGIQLRLWARRGGCGREEEDGREEGAAAPLEALQKLPPVVRDRVASALCRLFAWLSK